MKPEKPITRKEMYLDVATGGSTELPSPVTREEKYLAKIAGESVDIPTPVTRYEMLLAAVAGESYTLTPVTRLEIYLAKAAGQDVEIPQPVTREEMYWFDYCGGTPTPPEREYTGAVPVTFVADGTPLLDYIISGNTVQSGTPTPDTPIMPEGTGERTGNLFDGVIEVGGLDANTGAETEQAGRRRSEYIEIEGNTNYNLSRTITATTSNLWVLFYDENKGYISGLNKGTGDANFTVLSPANAKYLRWYVTANGSYDNLMIIEGSTAPSSYIPYGYKIPISSANTTTPVYLGEVETTRKVKKLVLTGEESGWTKNDSLANSNAFYRTISGYYRYSGFCTHYATVDSARAAEGVFFGSNINFLTALSDNIDTIDKWENYLRQQYASGTPVTVWYVLATEETAVVNEPLMKIGDYADTLSMEQAGAQIPTANGSTTLDVETTVKPSEVYIKYRGEAVATLSMLSAEVSSPEAITEEENPEETEEEENGSEDVSLQHKPEAIE